MRHNLTNYIDGLKKHLRRHSDRYVKIATFSVDGDYDDECQAEEVDLDALEEEIDQYTRDFTNKP